MVVIGGGPAGLTAAITATAQLAVANALDGAGRRVSGLVIPHCTYTDPEVGQVGITPAGAAERGLALDVHRLELAKVERAMIDGEPTGFAALYTHNGVIVGATFVAAHADNCLLSLMPSAGRTHKKLKKKLALVVAVRLGRRASWV